MTLEAAQHITAWIDHSNIVPGLGAYLFFSWCLRLVLGR